MFFISTVQMRKRLNVVLGVRSGVPFAGGPFVLFAKRNGVLLQEIVFLLAMTNATSVSNLQ